MQNHISRLKSWELSFFEQLEFLFEMEKEIQNIQPCQNRSLFKDEKTSLKGLQQEKL